MMRESGRPDSGDLWRVSERLLLPGELIEPGRWGTTIATWDRRHPFFERECVLESCRTQDHAEILVSRLSCTFAFDDLVTAEEYATAGERVYVVEAVHADAARHRADLLWLTWMGEADKTRAEIASFCRGYWPGRPTREFNPAAEPAWEVLLDSPLRVLREVG